jgi:hypothetical protein
MPSIKDVVYTIRNTEIVLDRHMYVSLGISLENMRMLAELHAHRFPKKDRFKVTMEELKAIGAPESEFGAFAYTKCGIFLLSMYIETKEARELSIRIAESSALARATWTIAASMCIDLDKLAQDAGIKL